MLTNYIDSLVDGEALMTGEKKRGTKSKSISIEQIEEGQQRGKEIDDVKNARELLAQSLSEFIRSGMKRDNYSDIVIVNIGTPREIFDALGPLIGTKLEQSLSRSGLKFSNVDTKKDFTCSLRFQGRRFKEKQGVARPNIAVYGSVNKPVDRLNYKKTVEHIYQNYSNPFIIATDACIYNSKDKVGRVLISDAKLKPGSALHQDNPAIGNVSILGGVGVDIESYKQRNSTVNSFLRWLMTEANKVSKHDHIDRIAEIVSDGLVYSLHSCKKEMKL